MEFIEYYQIIRSRIWLAIMMAAAAFVVVTVYQVLPSSSWTAEGQMVADTGMAERTLQREGQEVGFVGDREFWGTLEQFASLESIADIAANAGGITNPEELLKLKPFDFERGKRGAVYKIKGVGKTREEAEKLTEEGMKALAREWDRWRSDKAKTILAQLQEELPGVRKHITETQNWLDTAEKGDLPGKPTDLLTWINGQITTLQGAIATAQIEIGVAQDRIRALHAIARREQSLPPEQRMLGSQMQGLAGSLQSRLLQLEMDRMQMLNSRTTAHPQVAALDEEIVAIRKRIEDETKGQKDSAGASGIPPALQDQITMAELDLRAAQRRVESFTSQDADLRRRIPELQKRSREYESKAEELAVYRTQSASLLSGLKTAQTELRRLEKTDDLRIEDRAAALPSPKTLSRYAMMAVASTFAGFVMGCMLVFVLHYVDMTFKNELEAEHLLGYPVLAGIPHTDITYVPLPPPGAEGPGQPGDRPDAVGGNNAPQ